MVIVDLNVRSAKKEKNAGSDFSPSASNLEVQMESRVEKNVSADFSPSMNKFEVEMERILKEKLQDLGKLLQEERAQTLSSNVESETNENFKWSLDEGLNFFAAKNYSTAHEILVQAHEQKKCELKCEYLQLQKKNLEVNLKEFENFNSNGDRLMHNCRMKLLELKCKYLEEEVNLAKAQLDVEGKLEKETISAITKLRPSPDLHCTPHRRPLLETSEQAQPSHPVNHEVSPQTQAYPVSHHRSDTRAFSDQEACDVPYPQKRSRPRKSEACTPTTFGVGSTSGEDVDRVPIYTRSSHDDLYAQKCGRPRKSEASTPTTFGVDSTSGDDIDRIRIYTRSRDGSITSVRLV